MKMTRLMGVAMLLVAGMRWIYGWCAAALGAGGLLYILFLDHTALQQLRVSGYGLERCLQFMGNIRGEFLSHSFRFALRFASFFRGDFSRKTVINKVSFSHINT